MTIKAVLSNGQTRGNAPTDVVVSLKLIWPGGTARPEIVRRMGNVVVRFEYDGKKKNNWHEAEFSMRSFQELMLDSIEHLDELFLLKVISEAASVVSTRESTRRAE